MSNKELLFYVDEIIAEADDICNQCIQLLQFNINEETIMLTTIPEQDNRTQSPENLAPTLNETQLYVEKTVTGITVPSKLGTGMVTSFAEIQKERENSKREFIKEKTEATNKIIQTINALAEQTKSFIEHHDSCETKVSEIRNNLPPHCRAEYSILFADLKLLDIQILTQAMTTLQDQMQDCLKQLLVIKPQENKQQATQIPQLTQAGGAGLFAPGTSNQPLAPEIQPNSNHTLSIGFGGEK